MIFKFTDKKKWKYTFTINEDDLMFVEVSVWNEEGEYIHRHDLAFFDDVFLWAAYHTRKNDPLVSEEARQFCEKSVRKFMKMKVFW